MSIRLDGENKAVEYNAVGLTKDAVRAVFKNPEVENLFDRNWHKIGMRVDSKSVSLFLDCKHIDTAPIEEREDIDIQGKTVIGKRLYDSVPIDVSTRVHTNSHLDYFLYHSICMTLHRQNTIMVVCKKHGKKVVHDLMVHQSSEV